MTKKRTEEIEVDIINLTRAINALRTAGNRDAYMGLVSMRQKLSDQLDKAHGYNCDAIGTACRLLRKYGSAS